MISRLTVENYALIERLDVKLGPGLNIITGETGAGKSIVLGALTLLLGGKADVAAISDQSRNCVVEGIFSLSGYNLEELFGENDIDYSVETVIRRIVTPQGKSRAYINDIPVQLATLREIVLRLVDIHSQHQSLQIGDEGFRTEVVDALAAHPGLLEEYRGVFTELTAGQRDLARLKADAAKSKQDEEYLRFQSEQLMAAALKPGELFDLEQQQGELAHAEKIGESLSAAIGAMDGEQTGILAQLKAIEHSLSKISEVYPRSTALGERIAAAAIELKDVYSELESERGRIDSDPVRLEKLGERLSLLYSLQQKHHVSTEDELIELRDQFQSRLELLENYDQAVEVNEKKVAELERKTSALAARITQGRTAAAEKVEKHVVQTLTRLGMADAKLIVEITPAPKLTTRGADTINFAFSANKKMAPQPAEKIASGGEVSRLMLAVKSLVARSIKLPTIIFDEIDSGVSGAVADAMGEIIVELAGAMQVINITHLPQVASKGETHLLVYKEASRTFIKKLSYEERVAEIAKMLSGSSVTEAAIAQARYLLG